LAKKGPKRHLKRLAAPDFWPIPRKEYKWAPRPSPGPRCIGASLPLLLIIRDILGYAKTAREARRILGEGKVRVDGVVVRNYKFPVGIMNVIEIPDIGEAYRVLPLKGGYIDLFRIPVEEAKYKLCRIEDKTTVKGGHIQLNLHDGRNILIRVKDPTKPEEDIYKTMSTLKITIPEQEILEYVPMKEGVLGLVVLGKNMGRIGKIKEIRWGISKKYTVIVLENEKGDIFQAPLNYVFPVGFDKPLISLPESAFE